MRITLAVDYTEATVQWEQRAVEDSDSDTGENSEAAGIRGLSKATQNNTELLTG